MIRKLGGIFIGLVSLLLLSPMLLYWWGLSNLETKPIPSNIKLTAVQEQEIWDREKEAGVPSIKGITPYGYILFFNCNIKKGLNAAECLLQYPGVRVSALAIRRQVAEKVQGRGNGVWQVTWAAYTIWVTQNWNAHQILATYHEAYNT